MKPPEDGDRHDVALFCYGVIADIMALAPVAALRDRAKRAHAIPGSNRTRIAVGTLRQLIRCYRRVGFGGLMPKARSDQARPRRMPPDVIEMLPSIKRDAPDLSVRQMIEQARRCGEVPDDTPPPPSTIHRLFPSEGLTVQQSQSPKRTCGGSHSTLLASSDRAMPCTDPESPTTADACARPTCSPSWMMPRGSSPTPASLSPTTRQTLFSLLREPITRRDQPLRTKPGNLGSALLASIHPVATATLGSDPQVHRPEKDADAEPAGKGAAPTSPRAPSAPDNHPNPLRAPASKPSNWLAGAQQGPPILLEL